MADASQCSSSFSPSDIVLELDDFLERIFAFINDRSVVSLVCRKWYDVDRRTRRKVTVTSCHAITPNRLIKRFHAIQAVKVRGKHRAANMLVAEGWEENATPWMLEISVNCMHLNSLYFRRMVVKTEELTVLARARGPLLQVLKLVKCSGFSTIGLEAIARHCRYLKVLFVEECPMEDCSGNWLHILSQHNSSLEFLNIAGMDLENDQIDDLATLASNCNSLMSLKLNYLRLEHLSDVLNRISALQELGGVTLTDNLQREIVLPSRLTSFVSLCYMGAEDGDETINSIIQPIATSLRKIDLRFAFFSVPGHCQLLGHCSNLEALKVCNLIGDEGLEVVASQCKKLRWLCIEWEADQQSFVTQRGLISVAMNCHLLQYMAVYVTDINNAALKAVASNCRQLKDFRLALLLKNGIVVSEYPLDDGVKAVVQGCPDIHHFALYLRPGFLTDKGMEGIGIYGRNLKWALFGWLGETDEGIICFANRCHTLKRLEIYGSIFSERAIASSMSRMESLTNVCAKGYRATKNGWHLQPLTHDYWIVELIDEPEGPAQFVAYRCLSGKLTG